MDVFPIHPASAVGTMKDLHQQQVQDTCAGYVHGRTCNKRRRLNNTCSLLVAIVAA
jgi:hypothetical protein